MTKQQIQDRLDKYFDNAKVIERLNKYCTDRPLIAVINKDKQTLLQRLEA